MARRPTITTSGAGGSEMFCSAEWSRTDLRTGGPEALQVWSRAGRRVTLSCLSDVAQPSARQLLELLRVQDRGEGLFTGQPAPDAAERARMFGGQLLAQALAAASFTVPPEWTCHSLHAYYVRPAQSARPTDYRVSRMRDGLSGGLRKVVAVQDDDLTCELTASFVLDAEGPEYQLPMPPTAAADSFPLAGTPAESAGERQQFGPIELVLVDPRAAAPTAPEFGRFRTWARVGDSLTDHPNLHRCALTYASDLAAIEPTTRAVGTRAADPDTQLASLDHALWFHRPFRFDDWLLFIFDCASLAAERGLNRGYVYTPSGTLVTSIIQETMLRRRSAIARA